MIEKLMLENNCCCVLIADLSNPVFMFPWQPWTLIKFALLSVDELAFSYKINNLEICVTKRRCLA
jgi:hypothetical protein